MTSFGRNKDRLDQERVDAVLDSNPADVEHDEQHLQRWEQIRNGIGPRHAQQFYKLHSKPIDRARERRTALAQLAGDLEKKVGTR